MPKISITLQICMYGTLVVLTVTCSRHLVNADDNHVIQQEMTREGAHGSNHLRTPRAAGRVKRQTGYIESIVNHSNYLRRLPGAANMFKMEWDPYLAKAAAEWVSRCDMKHGYPSEVYPYPDGLTDLGENIFATTASTLNTTYAVQAWYLEISNYDYNGPCGSDSVCGTCQQGKVCGHYTQVVWWNSYRIGCAHQRCNFLKSSPWTIPANFFICYYGPPGNYVGQRPYVKGPPCSLCGADPTQFSCDQGLCVRQSLPNNLPGPSTTTEKPTTTTQKPTTTTQKLTTTTQKLTTTTQNPTTTTQKPTTTTQKPTTTTQKLTTTTQKLTTTTQKPTTTTQKPTTTTQKPTTTTQKPTTTTQNPTTTTQQFTTTTHLKTTTTVEVTAKTTDQATTAAQQTTAEQQTTAGEGTTKVETTPAEASMTTTAVLNTCDDSQCPNGCELTNQACCGCRTFGLYRDCTCCPRDYTCCPPSRYFPTGAGCCPPGATCMGDGSCMYTVSNFRVLFTGRGNTYARTPTCPDDPMLALTADEGILELYFDGVQIPLTMLPNRFYPDLLDVVPFPRTVHTIALTLLSTKASGGGLLARSTDGRVSRLTDWRCMDYSTAPPPPHWMNSDYDAREWFYSAVYFRPGVVARGYPYYRVAPHDSDLEWVWINQYKRPGNFVYCRLTL